MPAVGKSQPPEIEALLLRLRSAELDAHNLGLGFTAFLIGVATESVTSEAADRTAVPHRDEPSRLAVFPKIKAAR